MKLVTSGRNGFGGFFNTKHCDNNDAFQNQFNQVGNNILRTSLHNCTTSISPSDGVFEYQVDEDNKTWVKLVPLRGENKKIGQVLSAFGLGNVKDDAQVLTKFRAKMIMWGFEYDTDDGSYQRMNRTYERWSHSAFVKEDRLRCRVMITTPDIRHHVIVNNCQREDCNKIRATTRISGSGDNTVMQDFNFCNTHIEECENKLVYGLDEADVIKAKKELKIGKANQVTLLVKRMKRGKVVTK